MNKNILSKSVILTAIVVVCVFGISSVANAAGTVTLSQTSNVTATFNDSVAN